jgi:hypothetical protein
MYVMDPPIVVVLHKPGFLSVQLTPFVAVKEAVLSEQALLKGEVVLWKVE